MQVSVEPSGAIERKISVSVPAQNIEERIEQRLKNIGRKAKVPGFRPGKAPQSVVRGRYEPQVIDEVVNETIRMSYSRALQQEKINPVGLLRMEPEPYARGEDLKFAAIVEVFPEIEAPSISGKEIEKPVCEVADADIERTIEEIRKRNAEFEVKDGAAEEGDQLTIDFEGRIDGELFEGGTSRNFAFILGDKQMLEAFEAGLVGAKADEVRNINFTFPEDYPGAEVAGKEATFKVTVKKVSEVVKPAVDDAFAEKMGVKEGGVEIMRSEIKTSLERELSGKLRSIIRERVLTALYDNNPIEVPSLLVEQEIDRNIETYQSRLSEFDRDSNPDIDREIFRPAARRSVSLALLAEQSIKKMGLKVDDDLLKSHVEEMATGYDDPDALKNWYFNSPKEAEHRQQLESMVLERQLIEGLLEEATVKEVSMDFESLMATS